MVFIEKIVHDKRTYYYISKNFRVGMHRWKKIRKYFGVKKPSGEDVKKTAQLIEKEAAEKKLFRKSGGKFKYLREEEAEVLEDLKEAYLQWFNKLPNESREKVTQDFLVRFTYNSNAIEGNTLSLRDTNLILQENIIPTDATTYEYNEVINSRKCMEFIKSYRKDFSERFLLAVHRMLTINTKVEIVGKYRDHDVIITGADHKPPSFKELRKLMKEFFIWYNNNKKRFHPLELACLVHTKFTRIHPFSDGNGRTARVISNFILSKNEYPLFFLETKDRREYYNALEDSDRGNEREFIKFVFDNVVEQLKSKTEKK